MLLIECRKLKDIVSVAKVCAGKSEESLVLGFIRLDFQGDTVAFEASDRFVLSREVVKLGGEQMTANVAVDAAELAGALKTISKGIHPASLLGLSVADGHLVVSIPSYTSRGESEKFVNVPIIDAPVFPVARLVARGKAEMRLPFHLGARRTSKPLAALSTRSDAKEGVFISAGPQNSVIIEQGQDDDGRGGVTVIIREMVTVR